MVNLLLILIQYTLILLPIFMTLLVFGEVLKITYKKADYRNLNQDCKDRVNALLLKINKNSYLLKEMNYEQENEPCIIITKNGILINEHKIKDLSDNALLSGLLHEIIFFEKKYFISQFIYALISSISIAAILFYSNLLFTLSGIILSLLGIALFIWLMENINFEQKKGIIKSIISQSNDRLQMINGLREYFTYHKGYLDYFSNLKYDINKQLNFLDSIK